MAESNDQSFKNFLKSHQPEAPLQSRAESERVFVAIEAELNRTTKRRSLAWVGAASFVAASFVAIVMTKATLSSSFNSPAQPQPAATEIVQAGDLEFDNDNDDGDAPSLEIGQDWIDLVTAY